ncbi:MAG: SDH family Clp fold serine proteinase [Thermoleophilia bacterium]
MVGRSLATVFTQVDILDLLYVFLSFVVCTPVIQVLAPVWRRRRFQRRLGRRHGAQIVTIMHSMETAALVGLPVAYYVTVPQTRDVLAALRNASADRPIDLVVQMPAGIHLRWDEIAAAVRQRGDVTLVVPQYALSGGGELALAARHVTLADSALVGPLGPDSGAVAGPRELAAAGLDVSTSVPTEFADLVRLYPQPPRQRPRGVFFGALPAELDAGDAPTQAEH